MANDAQLSSFLKEQIEKGNRKTRNTWILGAVLVFIVVGYMSVVLWVIKGFLEPYTAARTIASVIERNYPSLLDSVGRSLQDQAPAVADKLSKEAIDTLPQIRAQAEKQIAAVHDSILPTLSTEASETLRTNLHAHKEEIAEFVKTHKDADVAKYFLDELSSDMITSLDESLHQQTPGRGIGYFKMVVTSGIGEIKNQIEQLAGKSPSELTPIERLQRKLLVALTCAYQETNRGAAPK